MSSSSNAEVAVTAAGDAEVDGWNVKFVPFASSVESAFWVRYCREKLETIKLSEEAIPIHATFTMASSGGAAGTPRLECSETSLKPSQIIPNDRVVMTGSMLGYNTQEAFQTVDKNALLQTLFCSKFLQGDYTILNSFVLLTFANLKDHKVVYWFGIPALLTSPGKSSIRAVQQRTLQDAWSCEERQALFHKIDTMRRTALVSSNAEEGGGSGSNHIPGLCPYFICSKSSSSTCLPLSRENFDKLCQEVASPEQVVFGFFDPVGSSTDAAGTAQQQSSMGWPLRNMIAYLSFHLNLGGQTIQVLSYRPKRLRRITPDTPFRAEDYDETDDHNSILLTVIVPTKEDYEWKMDESAAAPPATSTPDAVPNPYQQYRVVGWELNPRGKAGPRSVNLKPLLDSTHLAIQAADLNLKLMKWRMIPTLNVDLLQSTKVLILGAGTLGCTVSRVLLGWGIRHITLIDYGKVSYSNPVRQSLFTLEDCHYDNGSGKPKAAAAADALKTIAADVTSEGIALSIPMPGHPENEDSIRESVEVLDGLMQQCDVAFLLTDTRESRWLPTVMAAAHNKVLINAALGLDSWLVMRHGGGLLADDNANCKQRYGCYFCNDVVAPENSTRNRTLDQQCTVTRPGLAPIASSMAVVLVSLLHHPDHVLAPAPTVQSTNFSPTVAAASRDATSTSAASPLGIIPHQIRGSLVTYTMMTPTVPAFPYCTACSRPIIEAYQSNKMEFVVNTCRAADSLYLENMSGLAAYRAQATQNMDEGMYDWEEDDDDEKEEQVNDD